MSARAALSVRRARKDLSIEPIRVHSHPDSPGYMGGLTCQAVVPSVEGEAQKVPESRAPATRPGWAFHTCRGTAATRCSRLPNRCSPSFWSLVCGTGSNRLSWEQGQEDGEVRIAPDFSHQDILSMPDRVVAKLRVPLSLSPPGSGRSAPRTVVLWRRRGSKTRAQKGWRRKFGGFDKVQETACLA